MSGLGFAGTAEVTRAASAGDRLTLGQGAARVAYDTAPASITVPAGGYSVVEAIRLLDAEGLRLDDIRVRNASLDEVFAALTARTGADA